MSNKYCQALVELRNKPAHELKDVGDQWRTPDNIFWGINTLFGPFVLDLFTDGDNAKCAAYYTAEDNALAHDWSERLAELKGAAFGNPPYSRASQHEGQYITGMRYIMKHASAMRDKGGRYVFLIKAATSEVWWPEDADHIAFIRGRIGFELPAWFIPKDEKQVPTGAFFAGAIAVFDKTWKGPAISYIGRDELEACGEAFLAQVRQQAEKLVREMPAATLTQCQQQVLDMLISYQKERGFPPTNQEVATMLGYRSVNAAVEHLRALEKKGVITIKRGVARGITLHTAVKDDDSEAAGIIRALLAGEENARLRAAHWLHERGLKV
ncbi:phage N-6-adenine-methyltransferase [Escherichia coli]|nr:phage N-6-adenine-methyltransferase [Escherichia coli]